MYFKPSKTAATGFLATIALLVCGIALDCDAQDITTGLAAHWNLDETSGTTVSDSTVNGYNGTATGNPTWQTTARVGGGLDFETTDGTDRIDCGTFDLTGSGVTLAAWVYMEDGFSDARLIIKSNGHAGADQLWGMTIASASRLDFRIRTGGTFNQLDTANGAITPGQWHHVAGTYDGTTMRVYIDGVQVTSAVHTVGGAVDTDASAPVALGDSPYGSRTFDGVMDDVRIYDRALTAADVAELNALSPVGHWKLDETSGTTAADSSGLGNDGAVNGTATWTSAISGNGFAPYYIDGDDYIEIPNSPSLENVQEGNYTVAAWFKPGSTPLGSGADFDANYGILIKEGWHTGLFYTNNNEFYMEHFLSGVGPLGTVTLGTSYPPGKFYHVVGVVDRSAGIIKIYVDGELVSSNSFTPGTASYELGTGPWRIGIAGPSYTDWKWAADGVVDDARIYSRVLSDAEVKKLYGLVGHWKLDETSGTTAADSSGLGNDGIYTNGPTLQQPGIHGDSVGFDGTDDRVIVADNTSLDMEEAVSMVAWVKPIESTNRQLIINKEGEYEMAIWADGSLRWALANTDPGWYWHDTNHVVPFGKWSHVAVTYNSGVVTTYVDGKVVDVYNGSGTIGDAHIGEDELHIGARESDDTFKLFVGAIDDVYLYNRGISAAEVAELYGLVGHWKLDETSGATAADSSGLGNDGIYTNGPTLQQPGIHGDSVGFDGTDDRIIVADNSSLVMEETMSMAAWVKPIESTNRQLIVNKEGEYEMAIWADGSLRWAFANTDPTWASWHDTGHVVPFGQWSHVAVSYDNGIVTTYVGGKVVDVYNGSGTIGDGHTSLNELHIGARESNNTTLFVGTIDDVYLYNRSISATEVTELFGLMGHWKLDETSGTVAADSSGLGNDGTYVNEPVLGDCGPYQSSVEFNASDTDDRVDLPHTVLDESEDASVSFWIKTSKSGTTSVLSGATASRQNSFLIYFYNDTNLRLYKDDSLYNFEIETVADDQWHHFVFTWQGSSKLVTLFRKGELVGSGVMSGATTAPIQIDPGGLMLAQEQDSVGGSFVASQVVEGSLDDVQIYNRAILANEVASLYGLMGHWKLDETSGTVAVDSSPFANDGEYENGPLLGENGPVGKAVRFDGTDDRVIAADQPSYSTHTSSGLTVSAWVKVLTVNTDLHAQTRQPMVAKGIAPFWEWALYSYDGGYAGFSVWQAGGSSHSEIGGGPLPLGVWKHVVGTYEPGFGTRLYVDGVQTAQGTTLQGVPYDGLQPLLIGAREDNQYLNAVIDDVRIYQRILCADEVEDLSNGGVNGVRIIKWVETF